MVNFIFLRLQILGEWGMCQFRGFLSTHVINYQAHFR